MNVLLLGLFAGLFVFGGVQVRRFEGEAAKEIASKLQGDAKQVKIHVRAAGLSGALASATIEASRFATDELPLFTEPERSTRGVVHELRIRLSDFELRGLRVASLNAKIPSCRFDYSLAVRHHTIRLSRSGLGSGSVTLRQEALDPFVLGKFQEIKRVSIKVGEGRIRVQGYGEFLVVHANFDVDATLGVVDGTKLVLTDARVLLDGKPAEGLARDALLQTLNPVIDLDEDLHLFGAMQIQQLSLRDGTIVASGRTRIPIRPAHLP